MPRQPSTCTKCGSVGMWRTFTCRTCTRRDKVDGTLEPSSDPSWRPTHWPPACPRCSGFGYVNGYVNGHLMWSSCPDCREHPGHATSFQDWTMLRG